MFITTNFFRVSPTTLNEGSSITCESAAFDLDNDTLIYHWDFGDGNTSNEQNPTHTYTDDGVYTITLTVTDDNEGKSEARTQVTVNNVAPIIDEFSVSPTTLNEGESIKCNATASDPGDDSLTYRWDFGDSNVAIGSSVSHVYVDNDSYTITLIVNDGDGGSATKNIEVTVKNVPPTIEEFIFTPTEPNEGDSITFNATVFDPGDDTLTYEWDFGDESDVVAGQSVNHIYVNDGVYTITLTVTDDDEESDEKTQEVTVKNIPPHVDAGPDLPQLDASKPYRTGITVGEKISFSGKFTDPGMDTYTITWDFDDETPSVSGTLTPTHVYKKDGIYTVTLTVKDDDEEKSDTLTVKVETPARLTAEIHFGNTDIDEGKNIIDEGENIIVRMDVNNLGEAMAVGVTPSLEVISNNTDNAARLNGPKSSTANIAGKSQLTFEWIYATAEGDAGEVVFRGEVTGEDGNSGQPLKKAQAEAQTVQINIPQECNTTLISEFSVSPRQVSVGQNIMVTMTVTNTRNIAAINVVPSPSLLEVKGDGWATTNEPPATVEILHALGEEQFTWTFEAKAAGTILFRGRALGKDKDNPDKLVCSNYVTSEDVKIQVPAALSAKLDVYAQVGENDLFFVYYPLAKNIKEEKPVAEISAGQEITVRLTVANEGEATATIDTLALTFSPDIKGIQLQEEPEEKNIELGGKSSKIFEWKYQTTKESADQGVIFTGTVTGQDKNSSQHIDDTDQAILEIKSPVELAVTDITVTPDQVSEGQEVIIVMTVENTGGVLAYNVTPTLKFEPENANLTLSPPDPPQQDIPAQESRDFRWTLKAKENSNGEYALTGSASGIDVLSGEKIHSDKFTFEGKLTVQTPSKLTIDSIVIKPSLKISEGQDLTVTIIVRNEGQATAQDVEALLEPSILGKLLKPVAPDKQDIPGQTSRSFDWQYSTASGSAAVISFVASAKGKDKNSQAEVITEISKTSEPLWIQIPAQLSARLNLFDDKGKAVSEISAGQTITAALTVENSGEATAMIDTLALAFPSDINGIIPKDEPEEKNIELGGESSQTFEWKYESTEESANQLVTFTGTVTGKDRNSAQTKSTPPPTATLNIKSPTKLAVENITVTPNRISDEQEVIIVMTVKNTGGVLAYNVTPTLKFAPETSKITLSPSDPPQQSIPPQESQDYRWICKTQPGSNGAYTFTVSASGTDQLSESTINSNESQAELTIQTLAKLTIESVTVNPIPKISEGQNLTVAVTVHNSGQATAKDVEVLIEPSIAGKVLNPVPSKKQNISGNSDSRPFIWEYNTAAGSASTISFIASARGKDNNSHTDIFTENNKTSDLLHIQTPAQLFAQISIFDEKGKAVAEISAEQEITVTVTVTNEGEAKTIETQPKLEVAPEQGITLVQKPEPEVIDIVGKESYAFEWIYQTEQDSAGQDVIFTATVEGEDENSQLKKTAKNAFILTINPKTDLSVTRLEIQPEQISYGQDFLVVMSVKNQGGVKALGVTPFLRLVPENINIIPPDQPTPPSADIRPDETQDYRWTYKTQAGSQGTYHFIGGASGIDEKSSALIFSNEVTSETLTIQTPADIVFRNVVVDPDSINEGQPFKVIVPIYNKGEATAEGVETRLEPSIAVEGLKQISPGSKNISGQTEMDFIFQYSTTEGSAAALSFTASASGKDQNSGRDILTREAKISSRLDIQLPAKLSAHINIFDENRKPVTEISTGQTIIISLVVENIGGAIAIGVTPSLNFSPQTGITQKEEPERKNVDIISGSTYTFEWKYQTDDTSSGQEVTFIGFVVGRDENSQEEVKADAKTILFIKQKAGLEITALGFTQYQLSEGQDIEIVMTVRNTGEAAALDVKPTLQFEPENDNIIPPDNPPLPTTIPAGGIRDFTWRYRTQSGSKGEYTFTGDASGEDENSGEMVFTEDFTSDELTIQTPAELAIESIVVTDPDISYGQEIEVVVTVQNHGEAEAEQVEPQLTLVQVKDGKNIQLTDEPKTGVTISGNSSREFTWKYSTEAGSEGQIRFEGKVTGGDVNSKKKLPPSQGTSNDVFIETPAQFTASVDAFEIIPPAPFNKGGDSDSRIITEGQQITVTMTVENEGEADAENIELSIISSNPAIVSLHSSPEPPEMIKKGPAVTFMWTYDTTARSAGEITFRGSVKGRDENSGNSVQFDTEPSPFITIQRTPDIQVTQIDVKKVDDVEEEFIGINQRFDVIVSVENNGGAPIRIIPSDEGLSISPVSEFTVVEIMPPELMLDGGAEGGITYRLQTIEGTTKSGTYSIIVDKLTIIDMNSGEAVEFSKADAKKEIAIDMDKPELISALYTDANEDEKIGLGDKLFLTFNEPVKLKEVDSTDFILFPGEFSLESRPTIDLDNDPKVLITLRGDELKLTTEGIEGIYPTDSGAIGIGVYVKQKHLIDLAGNAPSRTESFLASDIAITDEQPPHITRISLDKERINTKPTIHFHVTDENPGLDSGIAEPGKDFEYLLDGETLTVDEDIQVDVKRLQGDKEMEVTVKFSTQQGVHQFTVVAKDKQDNKTEKTITFEIVKEELIIDLATYPNPFAPGQMVGGREGAVIRYVLNQRMTVDINIYDVAGYLVRKYKNIDSHEGVNDIVRWNGKTEGGDVVGNGIYICELVAGEDRKYWRIAVVSMIKGWR